MAINYTKENANKLTEQFIAAKNYARANEDVLREVYKNDFIAISDGLVIDSDKSCFKLWERASKESWEKGDVDRYPVISTIDALVARIDENIFEGLFRGI